MGWLGKAQTRADTSDMTADKKRRPPVHAPASGGVGRLEDFDGAVRFDRVDALRGMALLWMAVFHFCFDLASFRLMDADFYRDPFWTWQRTLILSTFLVCAGAGQAIATHRGQTWPRFWRRWAQIAACAVLVSLGSWWMYPRSFISFGVLHGMAVMLVIARCSAPAGKWLWPLGALAIALPFFVQSPFFDSRWTNWVGLVTHKPITEDFVPILPWLGVMWWGLAGTQWLLARRPGVLGASGPLSGGDNTGNVVWRGLITLGQWSLTFYMLHQPVFIGGLMAWMYVVRPIH